METALRTVIDVDLTKVDTSGIPQHWMLFIVMAFFVAAGISFLIFRKLMEKCIVYSFWWFHTGSGIPQQVPGPSIFQHVKYIIRFLLNGKEAPLFFHELTTKYGGIFKFYAFLPWCPVVVISNPEMMQKLLTSKLHHEKPAFLSSIVTGGSSLKNGLAWLEGDTWKRHRSHLSRAFTLSAIKSYVSIFNEFGKQLVGELQTESAESDGKPLWLQKFTKIYALRAISNVMLGRFEHNQELLDGSHKFQADIESARELVLDLLFKPYFMIKPLSLFSPQRRALTQTSKRLEHYCNKVINEYRRIAQVRNVDIVSFEENIEPKRNNIDYQDNDDHFEENEEEAPVQCRSMMELMVESGFDDQEILTETFMMIVGGSDTTGQSVPFLLLQLALNPEHQAKCRSEVDAVFEDGNVTELTYDSLNKLKHLERCIKETLRLCPVIPFVLRQSTGPLRLSEDLEIGPDATYLVSLYSVHRNPEVYPDPEKFDPGRFLAENARQREACAYMPFSRGSRDCIGWKFSTVEVTIFAAWILRHFEVDVVREGLENLKYVYAVTLTTEPEIQFILKKRQL